MTGPAPASIASAAATGGALDTRQRQILVKTFTAATNGALETAYDTWRKAIGEAIVVEMFAGKEGADWWIIVFYSEG